jgi:hypothetical protein
LAQQSVPQQHPVFLAAVPKQEGFPRPSGHAQTKWGVPATTVITAVSQTSSVRESLRNRNILSPYHYSPHPSGRVKVAYPIAARPPNVDKGLRELANALTALPQNLRLSAPGKSPNLSCFH